MFNQNRLDMGRASWKPYLIIASILLSFFEAKGQIEDCVGAQIICSDGRINFTPNGPGIDDFANPNNDHGCLKGGYDGFGTEAQSAWYYFEFREDMPPNSVIEFTISPFFRPGETSPDYDFAIFGPNLRCDSLGSPVRCSFAKGICDFCPETGLGRGATDFSEPADSSDGFVAPMVVQPGDGFYLVLDNFLGDATGFTLTWGGSAAPYLNCLANPLCRNKTVDAGDDMRFCQNPAPFKLNATAKNVSSRVKYEWLGSPQALSFLNNKKILQPTVTIPANFTGTLDYILSLTDGECVTADAITVTITPNQPAKLKADTVICQGESTTISLTNTYQTYQWSNGATSSTISVNTGGTYAVTVSNGGTCTSSDSITVHLRDNPAPLIEGGGKLCNGESITLRTNQSFSTYFWSDGSRNATTSVNRGGNYSVTVTDANGCRGTGSFSVTAFPNPTPAITGNATFCEGQTTTLATSQSYPSYQWSSNETSATITAQNAGNFSVTVTDANGCKGTDDIVLTRNSLPSLTVDGNRAFCENSNTQLTANTNATDINWSTGDRTPSILVNTPGNYTVTVSSNGCQKSETIAIQQQPKPELFITDSITICPENSATLQAQGVFSRYQWSTGDTSATITVRQPGDYTLQVTDAFGCTASAVQTVAVFPDVVIPTINGDKNFCPDAGTRLTVDGNYQSYLWSNGQTGPSIQVSQSDTYSVTVSDANGCTSETSATVQAFAVATPASDTLSFCKGDAATLRPEGSYTSFNWSNGSDQAFISVSQSGIYTVTVTDQNNCKTNAAYTVFENTPPQAVIQGEPRFCKNSSTQLKALGAFDTYLWSTGVTSDSITLQTPGDYRVTATDANGCTSTAAINIVELALPTPEIISPNVFCAGEQITLALNTALGNYIWSNGSQQATLSITQGGTYKVTVTDENGCTGIASKDITELQNPSISINADTTLCQGASENLIATSGFPTYQWSNGSKQDSTSINAAGTYSVTVTDSNGCKATDAITIQSVNLPNANAGQDQTLDCDTKSVTIGTVEAQQSVYQFIWQGPGITTSNEHLQQPVVEKAGIYTLIIRDTLNGCVSNASTVEVTDRTYTPQIVLQLQDTLDCNTASVTIHANNSHQANGLLYQWYKNNREAIPNARSLDLATGQPGTYYFEIQDTATGCSAIDSIEVMADFDPAYVDAGAEQILNCYNQEVTLKGTTSSEAEHILFKWMGPNGGKVSNQLVTQVDQPGWYMLVVTNAKNGCSNMDSVLVQLDRTPPSVSAGTDQVLDCTISSVALQGTVVANSNAIAHSWTADNDVVFNDPTQLVQTINKAGLYILHAKDLNNGCVAEDSVQVEDHADYPTKFNLDITNPSCFGAKDGQIQIKNVVGGKGPYFFSLNGAPLEPVEQFADLNAGNYSLRVEDVAGCAYETEVTLKEGTQLRVDLGKDTTVRFGARITLEAFVNVPTQSIVDLKWSGNIIDNCSDGCWLQPVYAKEKGSSTYTVTVTNKAGCVATDDIKVTVEDSNGIFIPNAFSPNGDGYNDVFMIYGGTEVVGVKKLIIMNRWGNQVFEAHDFRPNDPTRGWNGRLPEGNKFNSNVFVYYAEIELIDGTIIPFEGDVTVIK